MTTRRGAAVLLSLACLCVASLEGCSSASRSPYARQDDTPRNPDRARELHAQATRALADDNAEAERLLREALVADIYHGPSHNNLGILYLEQGRLYDAAGEFEWARKLMPGHPDPRVNLALTLERAGKVDDALAEYESALALWDAYLPALQGRSRLQIISGRADDTTLTALDEIAMRGDADWRQWASLWRVKLESTGLRR